MDKDYFKKICLDIGGEYSESTYIDNGIQKEAVWCIVNGIHIDLDDNKAVAFYSEELPSMPSYFDITEMVKRSGDVCRVELIDDTPGLICKEEYKLYGDPDIDESILYDMAQDMRFRIHGARYALSGYGV